MLDLFEAARRFIDIVYDETSASIIYHLGHGTPSKGNDRRPAGHRFDHHEAERLRPVNRKQQRVGIAKKILFFVFADLT